MNEREEVILVNDKDEQLGIMEKMETHRKALLHRAFSVFIFNSSGAMLIQQRALNKYHSPGLWTNTCCSHPRPGETTIEAAGRRLKEELGFETPLNKVFDFIYRASFDNGLTENEFDHVFVGYYDGPVTPNSNEVKDYRFSLPTDIQQELNNHPERYTAWFKIAFPMLKGRAII